MPWAGMRRTVGAEDSECDLLGMRRTVGAEDLERDFLNHLHQTFDASSHPIRD